MILNPQFLLNELSKIVTEINILKQKVKNDIETVIKSKIESLLYKMNLVSREEYEVIKECSLKALDLIDKLEYRINQLEKENKKK